MMARISKEVQKKHNQAMSLINLDRDLKFSEKEFCFENLREELILADYSYHGAFFTPMDLAESLGPHFIDAPLCMENKPRTVVDLCAGFGILSYCLSEFHSNQLDLYCVEKNPVFVKIGKKLVPNATWICGSIDSPEVIDRLRQIKVDAVISNPPYGDMELDFGGRYRGSKAEYAIAEFARSLTRGLVLFILPQGSLNFKYSGVPSFQKVKNDRYQKFSLETGVTIKPSNMVTDDSTKFRNTPITTEVCYIEGATQFDVPIESESRIKPKVDMFADFMSA
ncbi:methyltransferase [Photobacterium leiognathi]|uniref:methyltransferase n=1 Tax=Photobacterium leiognathi TaxID=553611 RepID=UPI002981BBF3|nr:methyltransferase [Photobacterium leiognathi]